MKQLRSSVLKTMLLLSFMVMMLSVFSCTREAEVYNSPEKGSPQKSTEQELSIEVRAEQLFSSLYANSLRNVSSPELLSIDSMETEFPATKLYLANFNDGGFMLFRDGGGEQMEVLGHSDQSSLHFSDATENPILAQIFRTSTYAPVPLNPYPPTPAPDPMPNPDPSPELPPSFRDFPKTIIESKSEPYIKKYFDPNTYKYFGQGRPFNNYIGKSSEDIPAGCGPIAIVTLLSHYEMQAGGSNIDWKLIKQQYNNGSAVRCGLRDNADLMHQLRLIVKDAWKYARLWSTGSYTLSSPANVSGYLKRAGFNVAREKRYVPQTVCRILRDKHQPFILLGWSRDDDGKQGHYWVVDGYAEKVHKEYGYRIDSFGAEPRPIEQEVHDASYIHCTWGWDGSYNGWFSPRVINYKEGIPDSQLRSTHPKGEYYDISTFHIWK